MIFKDNNENEISSLPESSVQASSTIPETEDSCPSNNSNKEEGSTTNATTMSTAKKEKVRQLSVMLKRLTQWLMDSPIRILIIPYMIGIVWHGCHPYYSILTGDFNNARRWYIDENSLDPNHFQLYGSYDVIEPVPLSQTDTPTMITSLCHGLRLQQRKTGIRIPCFQHRTNRNYTTSFRNKIDNEGYHYNDFEVAKITPLAAGITPTSEAIVLVFPAIVPFTPNEFTVDYQDYDTSNTYDISQIQFQNSLFQFIHRLSSPTISPWLSKTIFIVTPLSFSSSSITSSSSSSTSASILEDIVTSFLNIYQGTPNPSSIHMNDNRLPIDFLGCIIRQLLVIDLHLFEPTSSNTNNITSITNIEDDPIYNRGEIRLLPYGHRGILPNMDLLFVCKVIYDRSTMVNQLQQLYHNHHQNSNKKYTMVDVVVHPYHKQIKLHITNIKKYIQQLLQHLQQHQQQPQFLTTITPLLDDISLQVLQWYESILHLLSFESILAIGPHSPHKLALERGIHSITIQGSFQQTPSSSSLLLSKNIPKTKLLPQQYSLELIQRLELIIRSLSNLHERLHHSTSLYLLVSKDRFIKHEEYLIPNLLLIIPLLIRALLYILTISNTTSDTKSNDTNDDDDDTNTIKSTNNTKKDECENAFSFSVIGQTIVIVLLWTMLASCLIDNMPIAATGIIPASWPVYVCYKYQLAIIYLLFIFVLIPLLFLLHYNTGISWIFDPKYHQCIQFVSCLLASYMHVAIAFGHVSLAFPSAFFWTPLIAFSTYSSNNRLQTNHWTIGKVITKLMTIAIFVTTCPFFFLVPNVFPTYTPYIRFIYIPLHMLYCIQHVIPMLIQ